LDLPKAAAKIELVFNEQNKQKEMHVRITPKAAAKLDLACNKLFFGPEK
jgi:hypothetical protein